MYFLCSPPIKFFLDLSISFIQVVGAWGRFLSIFLLHLYPLYIGIFHQLGVYLAIGPFFLILRLIPRIAQIIGGSRRQPFHNLDMIIHIKSLFGHIFCIFLTFLLGCPFSLHDLSVGVEVLTDGVVFGVIPRDVCVMVVLVHCTGG